MDVYVLQIRTHSTTNFEKKKIFSNSLMQKILQDKMYRQKKRRLEGEKMKGELAITFTGVLLHTTSPLNGSRDLGPPSHTPLPFRGEVVCKRTPVNVIASSPFIFFPSSLRFFCLYILSCNIFCIKELLNIFFFQISSRMSSCL